MREFWGLGGGVVKSTLAASFAIFVNYFICFGESGAADRKGYTTVLFYVCGLVTCVILLAMARTD